MQDLTRTGGSVLIGREDEVARVEAVLDHLRSSMGEALVISGAARIGKSALLLHARWRMPPSPVAENHGVGPDTWNAAFADDSGKRGLRCWMNG